MNTYYILVEPNDMTAYTTRELAEDAHRAVSEFVANYEKKFEIVEITANIVNGYITYKGQKVIVNA